MTHTHDRLRHGQAGAVGMMIIVWLAVVVVVGVAAHRRRVDRVHQVPARRVASTASTQAANAFRSSTNVATACQAAEASIAADDACGETREEGMRGRPNERGRSRSPFARTPRRSSPSKLSFTKKFAKVSATETNGPTAL